MKLNDYLVGVVDNRGKNPKHYYENSIYPVLDNYLIKNELYPNMSECKRYIDQDTFDSFLRGYTFKGMVVMTLVGNGIGNVTTIPSDDVVIIQNTIGFVPNTTILDNRYLYYFFLSNIDYIKKFDRGSGQPSIKKTDILSFEVTFPKLYVQKRISEVLSSLDKKISINTAINENLEQQAQAIFKSWFVDFEPFGGVKPDDWRLGTFSDIIESTLGGDWGKETSTGNYTERVYCIRGADIPEVKAGNKGKMPTRYILPKNFKNKKLIANDIVVEISGGSPTQSTGRVAAISQSLLDRYDCGMVCTNFCRAIKPCEGYSYYTYYYWQYLYDRNVFFSYENGTTGIKNLDLSGFVETESIIIPSIKAIQEFNSLIDSFHSRVFKNGQENENIAALRDTLLPKLMNGEIDVSNVRI